MKHVRTLIASAVTAIALAGCASTTSGTPAAAPASTTAQPTASASPDCNQQALAWKNAGARSQLLAIGTDAGGVSDASTALARDLSSGADPTTAEASMQSAAASLSADVGAARTNLPPSCVPGLRAHVSAALTDYARAASDCQNAVSALSSGSYSLATADMEATGNAEDAGNRKIARATDDLRKFNAS